MRKCFVVSGFDVDTTEVKLNALHEINGQLNHDVESGFLYRHDEKNVTFLTSELGPHGHLAAHRADGTVCIQVISGSGVTGLVDTEGKASCEITLNAGDLVVFKPDMVPHYYKAGKHGLVYVAISIPDLR